MLSAHGWWLHPAAALRASGFSFDLWESLVPPELTAAAAVLDQKWLAAARHREHLLTDRFPAAVAHATDRVELRRLSRLRSRVGRQHPVSEEDAAPELLAALRRWNVSRQDVDSATRALREDFPAHLHTARARLHRVTGDERVREAVTMLSPVFGRAVDHYAAAGPAVPATSRDRGVEHRLVLYLQRLVAKNETNSFFGPIGAAALDPSAPSGILVAGDPGDGPPAVFSSPRVASTLADLITADPELAEQVPLRRSPVFEVTGGRLVHLPTGRSTRLDTDEIDGWLATAPAGRLVRLGALVRTVPVDLYSAEPLDSLRDWLAGVRPGTARDGLLRWLTEFRAAVGSFATAAGAGRATALHALERRFAELTGRWARHGAGRMYADRSVVFEERESRLSLTVGGGFAAGLAEELAPVLTYWAAAASQRLARHRRAAAELFDSAWPGVSSVPLPTYLAAAAKLPAAEEPTEAETLVADLVGDATGEVRLRPEQLNALAPAITGPVFSSVDVLVTDPAGGEPRWVLGEAHAGHLLSVFPTDHFTRCHTPLASAARDRLLFDTLRRAGRRVAWLVTARETKIFQYPQPAVAVQLRPHLPEHRALPASRLTVRRDREGVALYDDDGPLWLLPAVRPATTGFDPLAPLSLPAVRTLHFGQGDVLPRVVVGRTVAQRASWRVPAPSLAGFTGVEQFLAARSFRREHTMPELVFVRLPWEPKPVLLDFRNPLSIGAFAGMLRNEAALGSGVPTFTEMLPGPDDIWLAGRRTFELRLLAVRPAHLDA